MAVNDSLVATLERTTTEDFGRTIRDATHDIDPWSKNLVESSMGVTRDGLGRGWTKICVFKTGLGGAASWRSVAGPAPTAPTSGNAVDLNAQFGIYGSPQTFPAASEHTVPAYVQASATLKEMYGSFTVPLEIMRLDQLSTNIANQVGAIIEGAARRVAIREILAFWGIKETLTNGGETQGAYVSGTTSGTCVIDMGGSLLAGTPTNARVLNADDGITYYDCLRLQSGEAFDVFEDNGGTITNLSASTGPVFVAWSDPIAREVKLVGYSGSDITLTDGRQFQLHPRSSSATDGTDITTNQPTCLESVVTDTGTVYGLNLTYYPYFKSVVKALNGPLTETILNRYVAIAMHSKSMGDRIDSCVTTPGVKANYIASLDYTGFRNAARTPIRVNDGYSKEWDYSYDGMNMSIETSNFCPSGTLYGLKLRDSNWQKITPPGIPGTGSDNRFGDGVEFIGSPTHPSIFVPVRNSSAAMTDAVEAPFKRWVEFVPEVVSGLKLTGLHELIGDEDGTSV